MGARTIFTAALLAIFAAAGCTSGSGSSASVPVGGPVTTFAEASAEASTVAGEPDTAEPGTTQPVSSAEATTAPDTTTAASTAPASTVASPPPTPAPTTTAAPVFLRQGDEGPDIEVMQLKLITLGYLSPGSANGVFGPATNTALREFQGQYGLGVDGVFGPLTDRALTAAANSVNVDDV